MSLFGRNVFDLETDDGTAPKSLTTKIIEKAVLALAEKAAEIIISKVAGTDNQKAIEYGDVIGVRRVVYKHFGIYVNDNCVIHYAASNGDFAGGDIRVHATTLENFLDGSSSCFVCKFPETYGRPSESDIPAAFAESLYEPKRYSSFSSHYKLYSPDETVLRALERVGEREYNLLTNNCEHFVVWCKTGVSESQQVNDIMSQVMVR